MTLLKLSITNTAVETQEVEGSNNNATLTKKVAIEGTIASVDAGADQVTLNEAVMGDNRLVVGAPVEIIGGDGAEGDYTIASIDSDTAFTVNEDLPAATEGDVKIYIPVKLTLPRVLEGKEIAAQGSVDLTVNANALRRQLMNGPPSMISELQALMDEEKITLAVNAENLDLTRDVLALIQKAERKAGSMSGTGTLANGNTSVTITLPEALPDADYFVDLELNSDPADATHVQTPWITGKTATQFVVNVGTTPAADLDFSYRVTRN